METFDLKNIIPITEARSRLSQLAQKATKGEYFTLTKDGRPKAILVGVDLWQKIRDDLATIYRKTFLDEETLPFIRSFSQAEITKWIREDKLTPKQKRIIKSRK